MITNRYKLPTSEVAELLEAFGSRNAALLAAIVQCTERARLFIVPCEWSARFNDAGEIIVTRTHNNSKGSQS